MTTEPEALAEFTRSTAQFFFEVGYGACWAEAYVRNGSAPFPLTDAEVERAWRIAPEAHEDGAEFDAYLARAAAGDVTPAARMLAGEGEAVARLDAIREVVSAAYYACEDSEDDGGDNIHVMKASWERLSASLDKIDTIMPADVQPALPATLVTLIMDAITAAPPAAEPVGLREALGRFGHHPEAATDYECEVDALIGMAYDQLTGMQEYAGLGERIRRAMEFRTLSTPLELRWLNQHFNGVREVYAKMPECIAKIADKVPALATPARTDDAGVGGGVGSLVVSLRKKYSALALNESQGRKERTRCSHYVQVLDELSAALSPAPDRGEG